MKTKVIPLRNLQQCGLNGINDDGRERLSIVKCRDILQEDGQSLSDEEILKIRDYLYQLAAIGWEEYQHQQQVTQHKITEHEKSHYLRAS